MGDGRSTKMGTLLDEHIIIVLVTAELAIRWLQPNAKLHSACDELNKVSYGHGIVCGYRYHVLVVYPAGAVARGEPMCDSREPLQHAEEWRGGKTRRGDAMCASACGYKRFGKGRGAWAGARAAARRPYFSAGSPSRTPP